MDSKFYEALLEMTEDAIRSLHQYEAKRHPDSRELFNTIRSIATACLDGDKLHPDIRQDVPPRALHKFERSVFLLANFNTLTSASSSPGPLNETVKNALSTVHRQTQERLEHAKASEQTGVDAPKKAPALSRTAYVSEVWLAELRAVPCTRLDTRRLVRMLEELNIAHAQACYMASAMPLRAVIDHVPPVFGKKNFDEVANNHDGGKSFKDAMGSLQGFLRKITDMHLHQQMRKAESLPTAQQVEFRAALDMLLAEVVRCLRDAA